jgi:hypothetical protein
VASGGDGRLGKSVMALQNFDLVAIRIGHKKEFRHERAVPLKFFYGVWFEALFLLMSMFGPNVTHTQCQMTIACAVSIRLNPTVIDGKLKFKIDLIIFKVDQCEAVKDVAVLHL